MDPHLRATSILDYAHPAIESLVSDRGWRALPVEQRIGSVCDFVREVPFGYNLSDALPASRVLADGYGQCNTKTTLLMALLRASGIPCRFHGATIHKRLQQGIVPHLAYRIAPQDILHSWAEVFHDGTWVELEGVICDTPYLGGLRKKTGATKAFLGFGVGTENLADPPVQWCGSDTAIQKTGVNQDFQTYDNPDDFYSQHGENLNGIRGIVYRLIVRHLMNRRVSAIRNAG